MNNEQKIYVPKSSAKEVRFNNGNSIIKVSFKADDLAAFLAEHKNDKGYVNLGISKRREVGKFGDTHCVWLDTWKPEPGRQRGEGQKPQPPPEYYDDSPPPF